MSRFNAIKYRLETGQDAFDHNVRQAMAEGHVTPSGRPNGVAVIRAYRIHNDAKCRRTRARAKARLRSGK